VALSNTEVEQALLSFVIDHPAKFDEFYDLLKPNGFSWACFGWAWAALKHLRESSLQIDVISLAEQLDRDGHLKEFAMPGGKQFSGRAALSMIRDLVPAETGEVYLEIVLDYAAKRMAQEIWTRGISNMNNGRDAATTLADVTQQMSKIRTVTGLAQQSTLPLSDVVSAVYDRVGDASDKHRLGAANSLMTGYVDLDRLIGGLNQPDFLLVAGRPGTGKTALLCSIAHNLVPTPARIVLSTLEMSSEQVVMRLVAMESGIGFGRLRSGELGDDEWPLFTDSVDKIALRKNFYLDDSASPTISQLRNKVRLASSSMGGVDLLLLDYIQLAASESGARNRTEEIGELSRGLKALAKEFRIPVVAAAQLSRAVEARASGEPQLSDLREGGSLEQDADIVLFLQPYTGKDATLKDITRCKLAKHRNGPTGEFDLFFKRSLARFETAAARSIDLGESPQKRTSHRAEERQAEIEAMMERKDYE